MREASVSRYKQVPLDDLIVDPAYQRVLDESRVDRIAEEFDPALLGTLEISVRNGKCAVFDGQHRLEALRRRGAAKAPCLVHTGLSVPEEAMLFVNLQTQRKNLRPIDRFRARLVAGEEQATAIREIADGYGYTITDGGHPREIGAITALDRVYARGGMDLLHSMFSLLVIWQGEPRSTDGALIEGLGLATERYRADRRWDRAPDALAEITATSLLRKAVASLEMGGGSGSRPQAVAKEIGRLVGIRGPYKKKAGVA
jgi:hypothetical protein